MWKTYLTHLRGGRMDNNRSNSNAENAPITLMRCCSRFSQLIFETHKLKIN